MRKILISFLLLFFAPISFAESYPNSCPVEARGILGAVGGCSTINRSSYPAIWDKCCVLSAPSSAPSIAPAKPPQSPAPSVVQPKAPPSIKSPSPVAAPRKKPLVPLKFTTPFADLPYFSASTGVSEPAARPELKSRPTEILKEKLQQSFNRLFRFFRFR